MAFVPPGSMQALEISRRPVAVALATSMISCARPWASLMRFCFSPSEIAMACCFSPSARLILAWRSPSDSAISARFSRSARICFSIASRMVCGGVIFLIS